METRFQNGYGNFKFVEVDESNIISIQASGIKKVLFNLKNFTICLHFKHVYFSMLSYADLLKNVTLHILS